MGLLPLGDPVPAADSAHRSSRHLGNSCRWPRGFVVGPACKKVMQKIKGSPRDPISWPGGQLGSQPPQGCSPVSEGLRSRAAGVRWTQGPSTLRPCFHPPVDRPGPRFQSASEQASFTGWDDSAWREQMCRNLGVLMNSQHWKGGPASK